MQVFPRLNVRLVKQRKRVAFREALECGSIQNRVGCDQSRMSPKSGFVTFLNRLLIKQVIAALR